MNPTIAVVLAAICAYGSAETISETFSCINGVSSGSCASECKTSLSDAAKQTMECMKTNFDEVQKCIDGKIGSQECVNMTVAHEKMMKMAAQAHHGSRSGVPQIPADAQTYGNCIKTCFENAKCGASCNAVPNEAFYSEVKACFGNIKDKFAGCSKAA